MTDAWHLRPESLRDIKERDFKGGYELKYLFEIEEEITECGECPIAHESQGDSYCDITKMGGSLWKRPQWCPLKKVDDVLDELKEALEADKPVITATIVEPFTKEQLKEAVEKVKPYIPLKHCGNCEYCNKYKEQEPCNSCKKQSNWKKRIFI